MKHQEDNSTFYAILITIVLILLMIVLGTIFTKECKADTIQFKPSASKVTLTEVCLNGNLYLVTTSGQFQGAVRGVSTIQVMHKISKYSAIIPQKCRTKNVSGTVFIKKVK